MKGKRVIMIGAGRLATQLSLELQDKGFEIVMVYSRTRTSAKALADKLGCKHTTILTALMPAADFYIYAVKDEAIQGLSMWALAPNAIHIHTAGSVPMSVLNKHSKYGAMYPMQTFSIDRRVNFSEVPIFVEGCDTETEAMIEELAEMISNKVYRLDSDVRKELHLAAVFACNFTNHLYNISSQLLAEKGLPFHLLLPLIEETTSKIRTITPKDAQTGPAVRKDEEIMSYHVDLLEKYPRWQELYKMLSQSIIEDNEQ